MSEATGTKALIFGMYHHLVDIYQVCLNDAPGAKNGPAPWVMCHMFYIGLYRENMKKIFYSETTGPRALIFGM